MKWQGSIQMQAVNSRLFSFWPPCFYSIFLGFFVIVWNSTPSGWGDPGKLSYHRPLWETSQLLYWVNICLSFFMLICWESVSQKALLISLQLWKCLYKCCIFNIIIELVIYPFFSEISLYLQCVFYEKAIFFAWTCPQLLRITRFPSPANSCCFAHFSLLTVLLICFLTENVFPLESSYFK